MQDGFFRIDTQGCIQYIHSKTFSCSFLPGIQAIPVIQMANHSGCNAKEIRFCREEKIRLCILEFHFYQSAPIDCSINSADIPMTT